MTKAQQKERAEAVARLREWVKPGDTLYTILRHVSASHMSRVIQVVKISDGEPLHLGYNIAQAVGYGYDRKRDGVKSQGAGMDMGFEIVYNLGRVLFPRGEGSVTDGGYLLNHRWL